MIPHPFFRRSSMNDAIDRVVPGDRWEFNAAVAEAFDDMLRRSVPEHDEMRRLCFRIGERFVVDGGTVVDLGCSRGEAMSPFVDKFGSSCKFVGVERSLPMLEAVRRRFEGMVACGVVRVIDADLREGLPGWEASLTLCVLTLQFMPVEVRQRVLGDAFRQTAPGGALILVEKVLGSSEASEELLSSCYWSMKVANGYSPEDVARKRASLEGVMVPLKPSWNEDMLKHAGFGVVECFWRAINFAGWVAVKQK